MEIIKKVLLPVIKLYTLYILLHFIVGFFGGFFQLQERPIDIPTVCFIADFILISGLLLYRPLRNSVFSSAVGDYLKVIFQFVIYIGIYILSFYLITRPQTALTGGVDEISWLIYGAVNFIVFYFIVKFLGGKNHGKEKTDKASEEIEE